MLQFIGITLERFVVSFNSKTSCSLFYFSFKLPLGGFYETVINSHLTVSGFAHSQSVTIENIQSVTWNHPSGMALPQTNYNVGTFSKSSLLRSEHKTVERDIRLWHAFTASPRHDRMLCVTFPTIDINCGITTPLYLLFSTFHWQDASALMYNGSHDTLLLSMWHNGFAWHRTADARTRHTALTSRLIWLALTYMTAIECRCKATSCRRSSS